jgi:hypothetical protein
MLVVRHAVDSNKGDSAKLMAERAKTSISSSRAWRVTFSCLRPVPGHRLEGRFLAFSHNGDVTDGSFGEGIDDGVRHWHHD